MHNINTLPVPRRFWDGAIFDLDGTLLDSMSAWDELGKDYLKQTGLPAKSGWGEAMKSIGFSKLAQYLRGEYPAMGVMQWMIESLSRLAHRYYNRVSLKPGVMQLLADLEATGTKLCIATASDRSLAETALRHNGILPKFSFLLTCTDAGAGKDKPHLYEQALLQLGTKKESTLVFEDALHAIFTAKAAGFPVAAVYDPFAENDQRAIKEISDYYISACYDWSNVL
ncbi:MAG: HAD family hydrolase [Christensenellales bacterium]